MSAPKLNLLPARVPIGSVELLGDDGKPISYPVMASAELTRAFSGLFDRIGGVSGLGSEDLSLLSSFSYTPDPTDARAIADLETDRDPGQAAEISVLRRQVEDLRAQVEGLASLTSFIAALRQRLDDVEVRADYRPDYRVNWERPGQLGSLTANSAAVTTLTASGAVTLSPANANVVLSPTGTGVVTINPATAGAMDNVVIGAGTAKNITGTAIVGTTYNGNTITTGTATLTGSAGKTLAWTQTITLTGTDGQTYTFPTTSATIARKDAAQTFTGVQTFSSAIQTNGVNSTNLIHADLNANSTQIVASIRNNDGTASGAGQTRFDWGNDAGANKFTIGLYASTHATKPGWAEITQQTNQPLIIAQNGNASITINSTGTGFFGVAAVARQVSGGTLAGVTTGLVNLGLFSS